MVGSLILSACTDKKPEVHRIGILYGGSMSVISDGFKAGMNKLDYIEGQNSVYDTLDVGARSVDQLQNSSAIEIGSA